MFPNRSWEAGDDEGDERGSRETASGAVRSLEYTTWVVQLEWRVLGEVRSPSSARACRVYSFPISSNIRIFQFSIHEFFSQIRQNILFPSRKASDPALSPSQMHFITDALCIGAISSLLFRAIFFRNWPRPLLAVLYLCDFTLVMAY